MPYFNTGSRADHIYIALLALTYHNSNKRISAILV